VFADFTGPVVSVLMATPSKFCTTPPPERIRLSGIECPQKGQAFDTIDIEFYIGVYTLPSFFRPDL
jgi:hypothetical protein